MIYITGDCHGNYERFNASIFPEQNEMTKDDYVIICGDFGGVWNKEEESKMETISYQSSELVEGRIAISRGRGRRTAKFTEA